MKKYFPFLAFLFIITLVSCEPGATGSKDSQSKQPAKEKGRESKPFEQFRDRMRSACPGCEKKELCMGGCPLMPEIVFCNSDKRYIMEEEK